MIGGERGAGIECGDTVDWGVWFFGVWGWVWRWVCLAGSGRWGVEGLGRWIGEGRGGEAEF